MAVRTVTIDPVTRIEGHQKIEALVEDGVVREAKSSGMLFRGFEIILRGRDPRDAQRITQRVCGVCPASHAVASALNLDSAFGIADKVPDNGRIIRNLILGSNYLQSHILHFYHLAALDYVDVTAMADYEGEDPEMRSVREFLARGALGPFLPRYEGDYRFDKATNRKLVRDYLTALEMRRLAHEMVAMFGGRMPHNATIVPGGVTEHPTVDKMAGFLWRLNRIRDFIEAVYIPDVLVLAKVYPDYFEIGAGPGNFLSYGVFDLDGRNPDYTKRDRFYAQGALEGMRTLKDLDVAQITESVRHSWFEGKGPLHPSQGLTEPAPGKEGGYSWIKSPRYGGKVYEVGPLARVLVSYVAGREPVRRLLDDTLKELGVGLEKMNSALGRHIARALDAKLVADAMAEWVLQLEPGELVCAPYELPQRAEGMGITEAPRGALGHWIQIEDGKIAHYQLVVPTTWNASPKDDREQPGPMEQALIGTRVRDLENPYELGRIVRSFDPCLACSVHVIDVRGW
ncbi:MAG TPA: nickel-dependent hydrogenase large subunit [Candidatus Latescibacteria bacterium]|nr:nickel-dependent hydrogenase large subunit [Candidatus Latescibacterota bacterium]